MEKLKQQLEHLINTLHNVKEVRATLEQMIAVYPFNEFEYRISVLLAAGKLTFEEYEEIRRTYLDRNRYLSLFEISAPRTFGETWAQGHLKSLIPSLQHPGKSMNPGYSGQYDFLLPPDIRIEVKASRVVESQVKAPLYVKALPSDSPKPFDMNFQQIKPGCCDVFIWMAVWKDTIQYWVLSSYEVEFNTNYSCRQHRGNVGEGQLHLNQNNIHEFDIYLVLPTELEQAIRDTFHREKHLRGLQEQL